MECQRVQRTVLIGGNVHGVWASSACLLQTAPARYLDQHFPGRTFGCLRRRLVCAVLIGPRGAWAHWPHPEFFQQVSGLCAIVDRLPGHGTASFGWPLAAGSTCRRHIGLHLLTGPLSKKNSSERPHLVSASRVVLVVPVLRIKS